MQGLSQNTLELLNIYAHYTTYQSSQLAGRRVFQDKSKERANASVR